MGEQHEFNEGLHLKPVIEIAAAIGLQEDDLEFYGRYKAKIRLETLRNFERRPNASLILVSAMTRRRPAKGKRRSPSAGSSLGRMGKRTIAALREPSLGPSSA